MKVGVLETGAEIKRFHYSKNWHKIYIYTLLIGALIIFVPAYGEKKSKYHMSKLASYIKITAIV